MKFWRKVLCGLTVMTAFLSQPLLGEPVRAADSGMQYLTTASEVSTKVNNESMAMQFTLESPFVKATGSLDGDIFSKPSIMMKGTATGSYVTLLGQEDKIVLPVYMEQHDKQITLYFQCENKWQKIDVPVSDEDLQNMITPENIKESLEAVKNVKVLNDKNNDRVLQVTLDGAKIAKKIKESQGSKLNSKVLPQGSDLQASAIDEANNSFNKAVDSMGDFTYTMTIDKKTNQTKSVSMDLTMPFRNLVTAMITQTTIPAKPEQKEMAQRFIAGSSFAIDVTYSNYDKIKPIVIPKEVKNAPEWTVLSDMKESAAKEKKDDGKAVSEKATK